MHFPALLLIAAAVAAPFTLAMSSPHHPVVARAAPSNCVFACPSIDSAGYALTSNGNRFPMCFYEDDSGTYTGEEYGCTYDASTGAGVSGTPASACPEVAMTNCEMGRKRAANGRKSKLEELMSRRPAKTVEKTEEMEERKRVMQKKRRAAAAAEGK